jgi:hypothetical protein
LHEDGHGDRHARRSPFVRALPALAGVTADGKGMLYAISGNAIVKIVLRSRRAGPGVTIADNVRTLAC